MDSKISFFSTVFFLQKIHNKILYELEADLEFFIDSVNKDHMNIVIWLESYVYAYL